MKIGIDLGGTKTEGILIDNEGKELIKTRIKTQKNYQGTIDGIISVVYEFEKNFGEVDSVGIGMPGAISADSALIKNANSIWLNGKPLKKDLENQLQRKVNLENDANCFALSEAVDGAGKGYSVVFGVILGTGVGGGIVINGSLHKGRTNIAGEWGHHTLHPNGRQCYCGKQGCVETYISGPALENNWLVLTGKKESLQTITENHSDEKKEEWKRNFLENFGIGIANVIDILDPDAIILGGGVSNIPFLYDEGKKMIFEKVFSDSVDTPILKNKLGDSAGVFGACLLDDL